MRVHGKGSRVFPQIMPRAMVTEETSGRCPVVFSIPANVRDDGKTPAIYGFMAIGLGIGQIHTSALPLSTRVAGWFKPRHRTASTDSGPDNASIFSMSWRNSINQGNGTWIALITCSISGGPDRSRGA